MAQLTGNKIKDTYLGLLKTNGSGILTSGFQRITDGSGLGSQLYLSLTQIKFHDAYIFPNADGSADQVLSTDGSGALSWQTVETDVNTLEEVLTAGNTTTIAISSSNTISTTDIFVGDIDGALIQQVKAAEALSKGDVVYISGGTGDNPEVMKAKANSSTTMPSLGIIKNDIALNDIGECITSGELTGLNLTAFSTGDELFVSSTTAGALVTSAPTGVTNLIQKIGIVIKGGSGGALTVLGAFRTNAVPNMPIGILKGDGTNTITAITDGSADTFLKTDGSGGYSFSDVGGGDVLKTGTIAQNRIAIWNDNDSTLRSDATLTIDADHKITLFQPDPSGSDISNYNIGGGNQGIATGASNIGFGGANLNSLTTGSQNIAFGINTLLSLTSGNRNVALGESSLQLITSGSDNLAIGHNAAINTTTGTNNVFIGYASGLYQRLGSYNTAIGSNSLRGGVVPNNNTSSFNMSLGYNSGYSLTSGSYNVLMGYHAGFSITTGSKNVIIGSFTGTTGESPTPVYDIRTSSNNIVISDGDGNVRQTFDNSGAATFNASVTATSVISGGSNKFVKIGNTAGIFTNSTYFTDLVTLDSTVLMSRSDGLYTGAIFTYESATADNVGIVSNGAIKMVVNGTADRGLTIASTGAATFSGSVTVGGYLTGQGTNPGGLGGSRYVLDWLSGSMRIFSYGADASTNGGFNFNSQRSDGTNSFNPLSIASTGAATFNGNVGIGTAPTTNALEIQGVNSEWGLSVTAYTGASGSYGAIVRGGTNANDVAFNVNNAANNVTYFNVRGDGAATFSSSVTASSTMIINGSSSGTLFFQDVPIGASMFYIQSAAYVGTAPYNDNTIAAANSSHIAFVAGGGTRMRIMSGGQLFLYGQLPGTGNSTLKYSTSTGAVYWDTSSRLVKKDIETIPYGLDTVLSLSPKRYKRTDSDNKIEVGFIADEVYEVIPELVGMMEKKLFTKNEEDTEIIAASVEYEKMSAVLVKAIQEQQAIIEDLKSRIEKLEV